MNNESMKTGHGLPRELCVTLRNVAGALAVLERIEYEFTEHVMKGDDEIATAVAIALQFDPAIQRNTIAYEVINGWVFLRGESRWSFQKEAAGKIVSSVRGVRGITNNMTVIDSTTHS